MWYLGLFNCLCFTSLEGDVVFALCSKAQNVKLPILRHTILPEIPLKMLADFPVLGVI